MSRPPENEPGCKCSWKANSPAWCFKWVRVWSMFCPLHAWPNHKLKEQDDE